MMPPRMFPKVTRTTGLFWSAYRATNNLWSTQYFQAACRVQGYHPTYTCNNTTREKIESSLTKGSCGLFSSVNMVHCIGRCRENLPCPLEMTCTASERIAMSQTPTNRSFTTLASTVETVSRYGQLHNCSAKEENIQTTRKMARAFSSPSSVDVRSLLERLQGLEDSLRFKGYSTIRIAVVFASVIGLAVYLFRESLRDNVAGEVSQVASRSLEDEMVIGKVEEFAKSLLKAIGHDDNMQRMAAGFMRQVIQREESREAVKQLVLSVLNDPNTRRKLGQTFQEVITEAVSDESTLTALKSALREILRDDGTKEAVQELVRNVFAQNEVVAFTSGFFKEVIKSEPVVNQATALGKQVTQNVITDPNIQVATSNTIWQALKSSVTPKWLSGQSEIDTAMKEE